MIKQYEMKDGSKAWMFKAYLGIDETTGKKIWTTRRGFATKKECQLAQNRLMVDVEEHGFRKKTGETFEEMYNLWFEQYKRTVKESTWCKTAELFRLHILPKFRKFKLDKIKVPMCQQAVNEWFVTFPGGYVKLKNYTANVLDFAISLEVIDQNPMKKIKIPQRKDDFEEDKELNFYSKDELKTFLDAMKELPEKRPSCSFIFWLIRGCVKARLWR